MLLPSSNFPRRCIETTTHDAATASPSHLCIAFLKGSGRVRLATIYMRPFSYRRNRL